MPRPVLALALALALPACLDPTINLDTSSSSTSTSDPSTSTSESSSTGDDTTSSSESSSSTGTTPPCGPGEDVFHCPEQCNTCDDAVDRRFLLDRRHRHFPLRPDDLLPAHAAGTASDRCRLA